MTSVPWGKTSDDQLDLKAARNILDADHDGLDDVKIESSSFWEWVPIEVRSRVQFYCWWAHRGWQDQYWEEHCARARPRVLSLQSWRHA